MENNTIEAFPLQWPIGFERSKAKKNSQFSCTVAQARDGIIRQVALMGGKNVIISSNVPVRKDGIMSGTGRSVDGDNGTAVYFTWKGEQYVLACDIYATLWENLRAIEKSIEAIRGLERWGASDILARAFTGFKALNSGSVAVREDWWDVLNIMANDGEDVVTKAYRLLAKKYHPDNRDTGDNAMFLKVKQAYDQAMKTF